MEKPKAKQGSKLLIHEQPLQVLPALALALGLNEAIVLQQLHYWLLRKSHDRDGKEWYYNTYADWQKQFPFWSISTIKRTMVSLEKQGAIFTANYNNSPIDKTKWYAINYEKLNDLSNLTTAQNEPSTAQNEPSTAQNDPRTDHIDTLHGSSCTHQYLETNTETTDRENSPPIVPQGGHANGVVKERVPREGRGKIIEAQAKHILEYMNRVHQRQLENISQIMALLKSKEFIQPVTMDDCKLVIDWLQAVERVEDPEAYRKYVNSITPFKPKVFERHRDKARSWAADGRPTLYTKNNVPEM